MSNQDFEREAGMPMQESVIRARNNRPSRTQAVLLIGCAAIALGGAYYYTYIRQPTPKQQAEETFNTARQAPGLVFDVPSQKSDNRLVLQPPPPPPPPPAVVEPAVVAPPPPIEAVPAPAPVDEDALRRQKEEQEARLKRLNSEQIIVSGGNGVGAASVGPSSGVNGNTIPNGGGGSDNQYQETDSNRRFAAAAGSQSVQMVQAVQNKRTDALIPAGMFIHGVLETAIQSDLPGMVRAITSEDVWSFDGRRVLMPKGSILIGTYRSGLQRGQTRVLVIWTRAMRSDGTSVDLGSYGTDDLGRSGLTGEVDNHYLQRFGSAAVLSLVGGVSSFIAGLNIHGQSQSSSGNNNNNNNYSQQGASQAQQTISQTMSDMANTALKDEINIPPTLHVDQGTRIVIFVQRDLDFSALYPDPVKEALYELRHPKARTGSSGNVGGVGYVPPARCCSNQGMVTKP
ncbi:type IV secretion system protein VirB10 [Labrys sp. 22185]|uniref:type IV secretion system protein VirB10 n=1 Tax=Labrys sp. 22185 TaxID=3453888 RepID=UPI003F8679AA